MKLAAGVHIHDGPTFNEIAHSDVEANMVEHEEGKQPVYAVNTLDIVNVLAAAIGAMADQIKEGNKPVVEDVEEGAEWARNLLCGLSSRLSEAILASEKIEAQE